MLPTCQKNQHALTVALLYGVPTPSAAALLLWQEQQGGRRGSSGGRSSKLSLKFDQFFVSMYNYGVCGLLPNILALVLKLAIARPSHAMSRSSVLLSRFRASELIIVCES